MTSSNNEKLLDVLINKKLSLDVHIKCLYKKAVENLCAVTTICSYLTLDQVTTDQFSYKVTVYLLPSNMDVLFAFLKQLSESYSQTSLRLIYDNHAHSFQDALEVTNKKTIHPKHCECLPKEIYKRLHGLSSVFSK